MAAVVILTIILENVDCTIDKKTIKSQNGKKFETRQDGGVLHITGVDGNSSSVISGGTFFSGNSIYAGAGGSGSVIMNGLSIRQNGGNTEINGVRYKPYTIKRGPRAGKQVLAFEGWQEELGVAAASGAGAVDTPAAEPGMLEYAFDTAPNLEWQVQKLEVRMSSRVIVTDSAIFGTRYNHLTCSASGASNLDIQAPKAEYTSVKLSCSGASNIGITRCKIGELKIGVSGASNIYGSSTAEIIDAEASGASNISGFLGTHDVNADASGMSKITLSAAPGATVNKDSSGMAVVSITRT